MKDNYEIKFTLSSCLNSQTQSISNNSCNRLVFTNRENPNNIYVLANAFLSISPMTNKKLQKLCYYAKAWYLALYNENLINESFEAWVHGAVNPNLYFKYKKYGFEKIPQVIYIDNIPEHFLSFAKEIYEVYGRFTGDQLESLNHQEDPWINARGNCKPWENCYNVISENDIKNYYRNQLKHE